MPARDGAHRDMHERVCQGLIDTIKGLSKWKAFPTNLLSISSPDMSTALHLRF